jgi:hypothetical protein
MLRQVLCQQGGTPLATARTRPTLGSTRASRLYLCYRYPWKESGIHVLVYTRQGLHKEADVLSRGTLEKADVLRHGIHGPGEIADTGAARDGFFEEAFKEGLLHGLKSP